MSKPAFEDLFRFSGRRNRMSYFLYSLGFLTFTTLATLPAVIGMASENPTATAVGWLVSIGLILPAAVSGWAVGSQRCRDFGWSGWALLLTLVPYVGWVFGVAILFIPGNQGENRYGPDPVAGDAPVGAIA
jgi:uncharacterized membrane protein YhaH (DUF805 family)